MIPINSRKNSTVFGYRGTPVDVKYVFFQISSVNICTFGGFFGPKGQNKKNQRLVMCEIAIFFIYDRSCQKTLRIDEGDRI